MYQKFSKLLSERGETAAQVSKATGIGENVLSNWKARQGNLSVENLAKIAKHFGVPIEFFLEDEEEQHEPESDNETEKL